MKIRFLTVGNEMETDKLQLKLKPVHFFLLSLFLRFASEWQSLIRERVNLAKIFAISSFNDSARFSQNAFSN